MVYYSYTLDKLVKNKKFVPYRLHENSKHVKGRIYWCGYWDNWYKVLDIDNTGLVTIKWSDGSIRKHRTSLNHFRDFELKSFEFNGDLNRSYTGAEWKALCCAGIVNKYIAKELYDDYFSHGRYKDYSYYYVSHGNCINSVYFMRLDKYKKCKRK